MLDQAFAALKGLDWGADPAALDPIDQAIIDSHGDAAARAKLESRLVALLSEDVSRDATDYICRQLRMIGTAASVPTLAKLLLDPESSHMARFALQNIPADEAAAALRAALPKVSGSLKAGVMGTLGERGDEQSVSLLAKSLADSDASVATTAAKALGNIGTAAAVTALLDAKSTTAVTSALLRCAESLLAAGNADGALAVYSALARGKQPEHIRLAAARGKLMCAGAKS